MYPHHLASSFTLLSITIILLVNVPTSLCAYDDKYINCSKTFQCANIKNIGYPFWEQNRPEYCGLSGFKLNCNGGFPEIVIKTVPYQVLGINMMSRTLTVATTFLLNNTCPKYFLNTTLNFNLFNYTSDTETLTLYYNCPLIPELSSQFNCAINGTNITNYYVTNDVMSSVGDRLRMCNNSIIVHVYQSTVQGLENEAMDLVSALNKGFALQWIVNNTLCDRCSKSGGQCGYNTSLNEFTCYCPDQPYATNCPAVQIKTGPTISLDIHNSLVVVVFSFGVLWTTYMSIVALCLLCQMKKPKNDKNIEAFIRDHESLAPKRYRYSDVKKMTKSFAKKLGQGGYGAVYKGKQSDGHLVAVKLLSESKGSGEDFVNEVASISRTSHVNIVTLLGFCYEGTKRALIYEFMPNGSLDKYIYNQESSGRNHHLEWKTLYKITVGIARGLEYLHQGCNTRILHFDIKPHNILLDEHFCPKISDFGLAKLHHREESTISMLDARGTVGYIAPEVFCRNFGAVSHKSDVYSYGMMVLEMVGGRKNFDDRVSRTSEVFFPEWIYKQLEPSEDLKLHGVTTKEEEEIARKMILVSLWCTQTNPSDRPSMTKVVEMLEGSLQSLPIPPKPF